MWGTRLLVLCLFLLSSCSVMAQSNFQSKEPGNIFLDKQPVLFSKGEGSGKVRVRVLDAFGKEIKQGEFAEKNILLGKLPWGWYEIREGDSTTGTSFAVVPAPRQKEEGWAALDVALSWLVPQEQYQDLAEIAHRAGVRWVRDRISWGEVEQNKGKFDWGKYDKAAQAQESRGLRVSQVFHDVPAWARTDGDRHRFPDDLRDVFRFTREAVKHFGGKVRAWEVWNEADIPAFSTEPASEYAAFLKAASLGIKKANEGTLVAQSSFALDSPLFASQLVANGTAAFYDIFNYHTYDDPRSYSLHAKAHAKYREDAKVTELPVWLTEAGVPRSEKEGPLSLNIQREQADYIAKSFVSSRLTGTSRHFFFILPHFLENNGSFGILNKDLTPQPGYAALAIVTNILGNATYKGEIRYRQPGLHIHVFDDGTNDVLVAWSDKDAVQLPLPLTENAKNRLNRLELISAYGSPLPITRTKEEPLPSILLSTMPVFLALPRGIMADVTAPFEKEKPAKPTPRKRYDKAEIVLRLHPIEGKADKKEEAFHLERDRPTQLEIHIYNFGEGQFQGTIQIQSENPMLKLGRLSIAVDGLKGMERRVITVPVTWEGRGMRASVSAVAVAQNGERSSPAQIDLIP